MRFLVSLTHDWFALMTFSLAGASLFSASIQDFLTKRVYQHWAHFAAGVALAGIAVRSDIFLPLRFPSGLPLLFEDGYLRYVHLFKGSQGLSLFLALGGIFVWWFASAACFDAAFPLLARRKWILAMKSLLSPFLPRSKRFSFPVLLAEITPLAAACVFLTGAWISGGARWLALGQASVAMGVGAGVILVTGTVSAIMFRRQGLGSGDGPILGAIGCFVGVGGVIITFFLAAPVTLVIVAVSGGFKRRGTAAFVPGLCIGGLVLVLAWCPIWEKYWGS